MLTHRDEEHPAGEIVGTRYWNTNGVAVAIVAISGGDNDWAAYIGATTDTSRDRIAFDWTIKQGAKLTEKEALAFFPHMKDYPVHYRE